MKVMCVGAGSAGLGVCTAIKEGMVAAGLSEEDAMDRFVLCNHNGALGRKDGKHGTVNDEGVLYPLPSIRNQLFDVLQQ